MSKGAICPECVQGKHRNCDGVGDYDRFDNPVACSCKEDVHPIRHPLVDTQGAVLFEWDEDQNVVAVRPPVGEAYDKALMWGPYEVINMDDPSIFEGTEEGRKYLKNPNSGIITGPGTKIDFVPDNDPGIEKAIFPEMFEEDDEDWIANYRMRPDADVIRDLRDVEVLNSKGDWVPAVPSPIFKLLWVQCHCGAKRWNRKSYQEHYAYAHILGMED